MNQTEGDNRDEMTESEQKLKDKVKYQKGQANTPEVCAVHV